MGMRVFTSMCRLIAVRITGAIVYGNRRRRHTNCCASRYQLKCLLIETSIAMQILIFLLLILKVTQMGLSCDDAPPACNRP
jgi:hypothetical protein